MQRKNHLRLILGIILIGSLAVLLIGYFALRKPAAEIPACLPQHILILGKPFCYRAAHRPCKG